MARLPYPDRTTFPPKLQDFLAQVPEHLNFDMMSYSQATIEPFILQGQAQYTGLELAPRDRELVILTTAAKTSAEYEFVQHVPISEAAMVAAGVGAAIQGMRPVVDLNFQEFAYGAMDELCNQAAKIHYMFGRQVTFPILYRAAVGGGGLTAAQHSQSPYSMFMNVAGLKMFLASTPHDIKGLLKTAIRDNNPVISFESGRLMTRKGPVP